MRNTNRRRGALDPVYVVSRSMLCRISFWTDAEWRDLSEVDRPVKFA